MTLPNFLIIGAPKAGTTSLYYYLKQHPEIFMSPVKEPHYFSYQNQEVNFQGPGDQAIVTSMFVTEYDKYCQLFSDVKSKKAVGEASALYLYDKEAAKRIKEYNPNMRLVVILRNPVERAYSNYMHLVRDGRETEIDFLRAVALEDERKHSNWMPFWFYKEQGYYAKYLKDYLRYFSKDHMKVILYDSFKEDPRRTFVELFLFLGVNPEFEIDFSLKRNVSGKPRSQDLHNFLRKENSIKTFFKPFVPEQIRESIVHSALNINLAKDKKMTALERKTLYHAYREDTNDLEELLSLSLSCWSM